MPHAGNACKKKGPQYFPIRALDFNTVIIIPKVLELTFGKGLKPTFGLLYLVMLIGIFKFNFPLLRNTQVNLKIFMLGKTSIDRLGFGFGGQIIVK